MPFPDDGCTATRLFTPQGHLIPSIYWGSRRNRTRALPDCGGERARQFRNGIGGERHRFRPRRGRRPRSGRGGHRIAQLGPPTRRNGRIHHPRRLAPAPAFRWDDRTHGPPERHALGPAPAWLEATAPRLTGGRHDGNTSPRAGQLRQVDSVLTEGVLWTKRGGAASYRREAGMHLSRGGDAGGGCAAQDAEPSTTPDVLRGDLQTARQRWEEADIATYRYTFENDCSECDPSARAPHEVVVWAGAHFDPGDVAPSVEEIFVEIEEALDTDLSVAVTSIRTSATPPTWALTGIPPGRRREALGSSGSEAGTAWQPGFHRRGGTRRANLAGLAAPRPTNTP